MIDFQSGGLFTRLKPSDPKAIAAELKPILVEGESVRLSFKGIRDSVVFTNKRVITVNVQGVTGKKRDFTSLPYSKIQAWSIETAGQLDLDAELDLWFAGLGKVGFAFKGEVDVHTIGRLIGRYALDPDLRETVKGRQRFICPRCGAENDLPNAQTSYDCWRCAEHRNVIPKNDGT